MSYYIEPKEKLSSAFQRINTEQRDKARRALQDPEGPEEAIHTARKHFKKIRALARLIRDELGEDAYKEQNVYYRDLGRILSELRDATSLIEALELLQDHYEKYLKAHTFREIESFLREEKDQLWAQPQRQDSRLEAALKTLEASDDYISRLSVDEDPWNRLLSSLERVYKRGYRAWQDSRAAPTPANIHEWRKRCKYLWYHYRLLKQGWKPVLAPQADETHTLSNLLGDHRDMSLLKDKVRKNRERFDPKSTMVLRAVASRHQEVLLEQAHLQAGRIYAEKPKHFRRRMARLLYAWQQERKALEKGKKELDLELA